MQTPYFSVVIPTKNRSHILKYAIQSLMLQTFEDFEIIIADNDDGPKTRELISGFDDSRIKYFKSDDLSMVDNWEFAISKAQGEYVLVIEDKQALKLTALETLFNLTKTQKHGCINWVWDHFSDSKKRNQIRVTKTGGNAYKIPSEVVLKKFLTDRQEESSRFFPSGARAVMHRDVIAKVKNGPLKRLCIPVNPDLCIGYSMLHYNDYILYVDRALVIGTTSKIGNGKDFRVKGPSYKRFIKESADNIEYLYDNVPIKAITIFNSVFNDYMRVRQILGGRLLDHDLDYPNYFTRCYADIQHAKKKNADMGKEEEAWNRAYLEQPDHIQKAIDALINSRIKSRNRIDNYLSRHIKKLKRHIVSNKSLLKSATNCDGIGNGCVQLFWHFDNPIDYLIWDRDNRAYKADNCKIIEQEI